MSFSKINLSHLWPIVFLNWLPKPIVITLAIFDNILAIWHAKMFQIHLAHSCPRPSISHFPKKPWLLLMEKGISQQQLGSRDSHWLIIVSQPFQWAKWGYIHRSKVFALSPLCYSCISFLPNYESWFSREQGIMELNISWLLICFIIYITHTIVSVSNTMYWQ